MTRTVDFVVLYVRATVVAGSINAAHVEVYTPGGGALRRFHPGLPESYSEPWA